MLQGVKNGDRSIRIRHKVDRRAGKGAKIGMAVFGVALIVGFIYAGAHLASDLAQIHSSEIMPFVLLGIALLVALGFEL